MYVVLSKEERPPLRKYERIVSRFEAEVVQTTFMHASGDFLPFNRTVNDK